jgi:hypothetical protein
MTTPLNQALKPTHTYEVRPRKDHRGVNPISDALHSAGCGMASRMQSVTQSDTHKFYRASTQARRNNSHLGNFNHCDAVIFIPTNVAALNPSSANSVALNSGIAKSVHVQNRKTPPSITFHTIN